MNDCATYWAKREDNVTPLLSDVSNDCVTLPLNVLAVGIFPSNHSFTLPLRPPETRRRAHGLNHLVRFARPHFRALIAILKPPDGFDQVTGATSGPMARTF